MTEYIIPTDARAEYRRIIQRANRRILSNLNYIKNEGILDHSIKTGLVGDFSNKRKWATKSAPLSYSTKFASEADYKKFMRHINKWGEDTGRRGGFAADPREKEKKGREAVYKAVYGLSSNKGVSLEDWKGDLPQDLKDRIDRLSLEQINKFFEYADEAGETFDSDQVQEESPESMIDYLEGRLSAVEKFYARPTKKKKKSRRKRKGRKKK